MYPNIVVLVCLVRSVIHSRVERKRISAIKCRIAVLLICENVLKNHFRSLIDHLCHFHILALDFTIDLLLLVCQEYIDFSVSLHKHLTHQHFQSVLYFCFQLDTIILNVGNHKACDVINICFHIIDIFDHKQCFQYIDCKHILGLMIRIDKAVIISLDDNSSVAVV